MTTKALAQPSDPNAPVALLLPGTGYTVQAPLLYWCGRLLAERGWHVLGVEWTVDGDAADAPLEFVEKAIADARETSPSARFDLIVAKSFGTFALPWARREGIPGVWLTPVLTDSEICRALSDAGPSDLAIGGDADDMWGPERLGNTRARLETIPNADHSLTVADGWHTSSIVHIGIFQMISDHLDAAGL
jgi:hypothetical protein